MNDDLKSQFVKSIIELSQVEPRELILARKMFEAGLTENDVIDVIKESLTSNTPISSVLTLKIQNYYIHNVNQLTN